MGNRQIALCLFSHNTKNRLLPSSRLSDCMKQFSSHRMNFHDNLYRGDLLKSVGGGQGKN
jgi:hypothetical protein